MSCIQCGNNNLTGAESQYHCPCDNFVHPVPLNIGTGLDKLPRQIATFPEFRRAMLRDLKTEQVEVIDQDNMLVTTIPLADWRARDKDDLGIMLLEMWAYICDSLSFYDEVLANEAYLRTSFLRPDLRRLVALLGYVPRPAVGALVELAAIADGRLLLRLPAGTAFRSGSFDGNPPQVFELENETFIHPFTNRLGIVAPHKGIILTDHPTSLLVNLKGEISGASLLLLVNKTDDAQNCAVTVDKLERYEGTDNQPYNKLTFANSTQLKSKTLLADIQLLKPTLSAGLWTVNETSYSYLNNRVTLNVLSHQVNPGDYILIVYRNEKRWFRVNEVTETMKSTVITNKITLNGNTFEMPGMSIPVTTLTLDVSVNSSDRKSSFDTMWTSAMGGGITVYFGMQPVASIIDEPNVSLSAVDPLYFNKTIETPVEKYAPAKFLLQDKNTRGISIGGQILYEQNKIKPDQVNDWSLPLVLPVEAYGNVITVSRGEKVENEKMGSGDASVANQSFKLKKKPLTYHLSPTLNNDQGVKSSLSVYVNGIRWNEVNSFFGKSENDEVYIMRQNDDGESVVTFGDGIRGQRLPTGTDNVSCNYRFGAEAACPPAGSVTQVVKPVKGLQSVKNILPAFGGADAESAENLRTYAPRSALILGRVVSIKDMEALAASFPGVRAVQTEWRWDKNKQRATAHIFYIGDEGLKAPLSQKIRSFSDPSTPVTVEKAQSDPLYLSLNVTTDPRYNEPDVIGELRLMLTDKRNGLLAPENIGIGLPLYRSRIFETVLSVKGTETVQGIFIGTENFGAFAIRPEMGHYFDIEQGTLIINGKEN